MPFVCDVSRIQWRYRNFGINDVKTEAFHLKEEALKREKKSEMKSKHLELVENQMASKKPLWHFKKAVPE